MSLLPTDRDARKAIPLYSGVLAYFPSALVKVAIRSKEGNDEHNPGQPLHWSRDKSADHLDCVARHLTEGDLVGVAWRALAALQLECEANGAPLAPGASFSPSGSRIAMAAEIGNLRDLLSAEELKGFGIGAIEPRHVMHAEALRDHDERLSGPEDQL